MTETAISVTKLDAAKRQLCAAIRLWFADDDPVAIHTLTAAAHELIHVLFRARGLSDLLFDSRIVKEERRSEMNKRVKSTASFFKHANKDRDAILEFYPVLNDLMILFCLSGLQRMGESAGTEGTAFSWWYWIHHPDAFFSDERKHHVPVDLLDQLRRVGKIDFIEAIQHLKARGDLL